MRSRLSLATLVCFCAASLAAAEETPEKSESLNNPPEGFIALFNGEDLSGWIGVPHFDPRKLRAMSPEDRQAFLDKNWIDVEKHWSVENGELVNDGKGPYLTTAEDYGDFELRLEYKTVPKADSGIYLRGVPQVQIWDTTEKDAKRAELMSKGSAGLFNNQKSPNYPLVKADKPFGQWNSLKITMIGESVTVVYNGKLVVNEVPLENYWDRSIPVFPVGPIQLQTHGGEIRFRNVYLREIPRMPPEAGYLSKDGMPFGEGWMSLFSENGTEAAQAGDVEYHVLFSLQDGKPAEFTIGSAEGENARAMVLTVSPESGVTLTDRQAKDDSIPVANTPAVDSGLKSEGNQHLYARVRGNSIQVWLNEKMVVDVLYPRRPQNGTVRVSGANVTSAFVRNSADDPRVEMFDGKEEGFTPLYNGKDLSGWIGEKQGYDTQPNVLVATKDSGNLFTKKSYGDFRFRFEFKLRPGANNGVAIRAPLDGRASYDGIESQILDNTSEKYADLKTYQYHGSLYGVVPALRGYLKPIRHWNQQEIIAKGNHIKVILNGKVIVDGNLEKASQNGTVDGKDHPGVLNPTGHLGFLGHGHVIEFRNLRVKSLEKK